MQKAWKEQFHSIKQQNLKFKQIQSNKDILEQCCKIDELDDESDKNDK